MGVEEVEKKIRNNALNCTNFEKSGMFWIFFGKLQNYFSKIVNWGEGRLINENKWEKIKKLGIQLEIGQYELKS